MSREWRSSSGWTLEFRRRSGEARSGLLALSNGTHAVVGDLTLVAGAYGTSDDGMIRPLPGPSWTNAWPDPPSDSDVTWTLDLRHGVLRGAVAGRRQTRFVSLTRPSIGAVRFESDTPVRWSRAAVPPRPEPLAAAFRFEADSNGRAASTASDRATIRLAMRHLADASSTSTRLDRIVSVSADTATSPTAEVQVAAEVGFDQLLAEHSRAWERRWELADIRIDADADEQVAVRFALFHLLSCAAAGQATIAARGLTGLAYAGHVFWDTDVYVVPALVALLPDRARAALQYRVDRLPAARRAAVARGGVGARFPWESADSGEDVTPTSAPSPEGPVAVTTGERAEHINGAVAWATQRYVDWTGDVDVLADGGRALITETAQWWTSRARIATDGTAHIDRVIGPDEYHDLVDDDAYTNQLASWHLQTASRHFAELGDDRWSERCLDLAARLARGTEMVGARHVQFRGYDDLDPGPIAELPRRPIAADIWLGQDAVRRTQLIKQPDVLMLHHLLPDWWEPESLDADLDHYLPRTTHGSSLSPAICASLLARAGRVDDAAYWFDMAALLDLDDVTGTTHDGLHLATMGGLWQAIVLGFAGVRVDDGTVHVDPHLPSRWGRLEISLRIRGSHVEIVAEHDRAEVLVDGDHRPRPRHVHTVGGRP